MVAGAFSLRPPFFGFFSAAPSFGCATGPSPWACFLSFFSSSCFFLSSAMAGPLLVDLRAASLCDANALAVLEHLGPDPGRLLRLRVDQRQVRDVDAPVDLHDAALGRGRVAASLP